MQKRKVTKAVARVAAAAPAKAIAVASSRVVSVGGEWK
jgi:hypothetical protein